MSAVVDVGQLPFLPSHGERSIYVARVSPTYIYTRGSPRPVQFLIELFNFLPDVHPSLSRETIFQRVSPLQVAHADFGRSNPSYSRDIFIKLVASPSSPFAMISKTEQTFVPGYQLGFLIRATWQPAHIVFLDPSILHDLHHRFASPVPPGTVAGA